MNITLRQLRAFAVLSALSSFTRAAEALHTTQPALSAQIRDLESALGVRLFDRNTRSVSLTTTGRDLLPVVDQILAALAGVVARAKDLAARDIGRIAVAALPSIAANFFPNAIVQFRNEHPGVIVTLHDAIAGGVADRVRDGAVDFGISGPIVRDAKLAFERLGTDRMFAVLPPGHPLTRRRKVSLLQVLEEPLILMHRDSSVRLIVDRAIASLGQVPAPAYETSVMATATSLVRAGLGITLLPGTTYGAADLSDLVLRLVDETTLARPLGIVRRIDRSLSPAGEMFMEHVRAGFVAWLAQSNDLPSPRQKRTAAMSSKDIH